MLRAKLYHPKIRMRVPNIQSTLFRNRIFKEKELIEVISVEPPPFTPSQELHWHNQLASGT